MGWAGREVGVVGWVGWRCSGAGWGAGGGRWEGR